MVFGTGLLATKILAGKLRKGNLITGVFDNDETKWGQHFMADSSAHFDGWEVRPPADIKKEKFDFLLIAANHRNTASIRKQLLLMEVPAYKLVTVDDMAEAQYLPSRLDFIFQNEKIPPKPFSRKPAEIYRHYEGETTRCRDRRVREGFFDKYCQGEGLDVGYGGDVITPTAAGWDLRNGDAQYLSGVEDESFDFVYSSHCIEHMQNVRVALQNWFRVVKPGGYLLLYLPHRDLYEKQTKLPSLFNPDHKHMFLLGRRELPDTLDIVEEITSSLQDYDIKYVKVCDEGYIRNEPGVQAHGEYSIEAVIQKVGHVHAGEGVE